MFKTNRPNPNTSILLSHKGDPILEVATNKTKGGRSHVVRALYGDQSGAVLCNSDSSVMRRIKMHANNDSQAEFLPESVVLYLDYAKKIFSITKPDISLITPDSPSATVELTQGLVAIVDCQMKEWIDQWNWHAYKCASDLVYAGRHNPSDSKVRAQMHREILGLSRDDGDVDHINGNGLDNRVSNLRICTARQNCHNTKRGKGNTSGYKGVNWNCDHKKWLSRIMIDGKSIILGWFATPLEGAIAYNEAAKKYFGEFARLNVIE